jgi:MFS family permease
MTFADERDSSQKIMASSVASLFVNGLAGGYLWPFLPIILQTSGVSPAGIGLVFAAGNIFILSLRLPLGYLMDHCHPLGRLRAGLLLIPFPALVAMIVRVHHAGPAILSVLALHVSRMPFLPLSLALLKIAAEKGKRHFTPHVFVIVQHLFLGGLGLLAGITVLGLGVQRTFLSVTAVIFIVVASLLFMGFPSAPPAQFRTKRAWYVPDLKETLMLASFFSFHLVNAPILPFAEIYMKSVAPHVSWVPWTAGIAEIAMALTAAALIPLNRSRSRSFWILISASAVLACRMGGYSLSPGAPETLVISLLDGYSSGAFWIVSLSWAAGRMAGRDGFNQLAGYVDVAVAVGGILGNIAFGWGVGRWGFPGASGMFLPLNLLAPLFLVLAGRTAWTPHPFQKG